MSLSEVEFKRAVRLGRLVPKEIIKFKTIERVIETPPVKPRAPEIIPYLVYRHYPSTEDIIAIVAAFYGTSIIEILCDRRTAALTRPRHVAAYLLKELTLISFPRIARALNRTDHTTAIHAVKKIAALHDADDEIRTEVAILKARIAERHAARNVGARGA